MASDPRAALDRLVAALEAHLTAAQHRRGEADPGVEAAYRALADAFEAYDEGLYAAYDEVTPFVLYDDVEDEADDDLEDLDDDEEEDDEEDDDDADDDLLAEDDPDDAEDDDDEDDTAAGPSAPAGGGPAAPGVPPRR